MVGKGGAENIGLGAAEETTDSGAKSCILDRTGGNNNYYDKALLYASQQNAKKRYSSRITIFIKRKFYSCCPISLVHNDAGAYVCRLASQNA